MRDSMIFQKAWFESIADDELLETSPQEMAYILYAAARYCYYDEKINMGEVFGNEFKSLNRDMPNIYTQIDKIANYGSTFGNGKSGNQKYDSEKIEELARQGMTQKEICEELGYDVSKSRSLSSNAGYKRGRAAFEGICAKVEAAVEQKNEMKTAEKASPKAAVKQSDRNWTF